MVTLPKYDHVEEQWMKKTGGSKEDFANEIEEMKKTYEHLTKDSLATFVARKYNIDAKGEAIRKRAPIKEVKFIDELNKDEYAILRCWLVTKEQKTSKKGNSYPRYTAIGEDNKRFFIYDFKENSENAKGQCLSDLFKLYQKVKLKNAICKVLPNGDKCLWFSQYSEVEELTQAFKPQTYRKYDNIPTGIFCCADGIVLPGSYYIKEGTGFISFDLVSTSPMTLKVKGLPSKNNLMKEMAEQFDVDVGCEGWNVRCCGNFQEKSSYEMNGEPVTEYNTMIMDSFEVIKAIDFGKVSKAKSDDPQQGGSIKQGESPTLDEEGVASTQVPPPEETVLKTITEHPIDISEINVEDHMDKVQALFAFAKSMPEKKLEDKLGKEVFEALIAAGKLKFEDDSDNVVLPSILDKGLVEQQKEVDELYSGMEENEGVNKDEVKKVKDVIRKLEREFKNAKRNEIVKHLGWEGETVDTILDHLYENGDVLQPEPDVFLLV
jgi:hypothetical protein